MRIAVGNDRDLTLFFFMIISFIIKNQNEEESRRLKGTGAVSLEKLAMGV
jgi:hypothetical protein